MTVERIRCGGLLALSLLVGLVLALPVRASLFTFSLDSPVTFNDSSGGSLQLLAFSREFTEAEPGVTNPSPNIFLISGGILNADGVSHTLPSPFPSGGPGVGDSSTLSALLSVSHNGETVSQTVDFLFQTVYIGPAFATHSVQGGDADFVFSDGRTLLRINQLSATGSAPFPVTAGGTYTSDLHQLGMTFIVPEPATLTVLGAALVGLAAVRRRRRPAA